MAEKKASLTVLGGPMAGTRFVLEGIGSDMVLGADPSCHFQLALAGVSATHARIRSDGSAYTIEDAGSEHGLHVNDSRVTEAVPLRNGDIVWLGTPGEADVVMLQCILPSRAAAAPVPPPAPEPEAALSEDETLALALAAEAAAPPQTDLMDEAATAFYTSDEAAAASGAPFAGGTEEAPFASAGEGELVVAEDETVAQPVPFAIDAAPPPPPPAHFEDDTREQTFEFSEEEQTTVVMGAPEEAAPAAVYTAETGFMEEDPSTVIMASEPEATMAIEAPSAPDAPLPETEFITTPASPPMPAAPPVAPPPPAPPKRSAPPPAVTPPQAPAAPPAAAPRAPRPAAAASPAPAPAPRRPAARPQPTQRAADDAAADVTPERAPRSAPPVALYAGLGAAALVVLGGGYWAFSKLRSSAPTPTVADSPPTTMAAARPTPRPTERPAEPSEVPVEVQPETPPPTLPTPVTVATPAATPTTTLRPVPSPLPSPSPAAKKGAPTPTPVPTPAGPSPEQLRAQQVASLLGQGEAALAAGQFDQAIGHFDEVLRLEGGNDTATAGRASAVSLRDASRKKFVAGRTVVKTEKASGGGLAGFEGAEVQRTPDFSGRIEFEMSPASGLKPGDAWTLKFFLVNDGKKGIKIGGVTATTNVNGTGAGGPLSAGIKEIAPQQRAQLGQLTGSWREATTSWTADVLVTANKGDSLKNTLTWK